MVQKALIETAQIFTILPPTERARLAALGMHNKLAETATSSSSASPSSVRPDNAAPRTQDPSGMPHGDMGDALVSAPSLFPPHDSGTATARKHRQEHAAAPEHTPAHTAGGAQRCGWVSSATGETTAPPTMTTQAPSSSLPTKRAEFPTLAAMRA